jgi:hypothetical protein
MPDDKKTAGTPDETVQDPSAAPRYRTYEEFAQAIAKPAKVLHDFYGPAKSLFGLGPNYSPEEQAFNFVRSEGIPLIGSSLADRSGKEPTPEVLQAMKEVRQAWARTDKAWSDHVFTGIGSATALLGIKGIKQSLPAPVAASRLTTFATANASSLVVMDAASSELNALNFNTRVLSVPFANASAAGAAAGPTVDAAAAAKAEADKKIVDAFFAKAARPFAPSSPEAAAGSPAPGPDPAQSSAPAGTPDPNAPDGEEEEFDLFKFVGDNWKTGIGVAIGAYLLHDSLQIPALLVLVASAVAGYFGVDGLKSAWATVSGQDTSAPNAKVEPPSMDHLKKMLPVLGFGL